jgi:hypothetical protein
VDAIETDGDESVKYPFELPPRIPEAVLTLVCAIVKASDVSVHADVELSYKAA